MEIQIREGNSRQKRKLKVCAYCRVSTDADEQENSLETRSGIMKKPLPVILITSMPEFTVTLPYQDSKKNVPVCRRC